MRERGGGGWERENRGGRKREGEKRVGRDGEEWKEGKRGRERRKREQSNILSLQNQPHDSASGLVNK